MSLSRLALSQILRRIPSIIGSLVLLLVCDSSLSLAQFHVGLSGGRSSATISGDTPSDFKYLSSSGGAFSLVFEYEFMEDTRASFQPGFIQKGASLAYEIPDEDEPIDSLALSLDYITLPLMVRVITDTGWLYVIGGPEIGILSSATAVFEGDTEDVDFSDQVKSLDASVNFGVGGMFSIGPVRSFVELRFSIGLININDSGTDDRYRTKANQLLVGLLLPLGSK